MADCYTQFCEPLEISSWQKLWLERHLHYMAHGPAESEGPKWEAYVEECQRLNLYEAAGTGYDFDVEFEDDEGRVIFVADESGSPEHVAHVVQKLFQAFHLDKASFGMLWSYSSSRTVIGGFSGGAVFVTRDKIEYCDPGAWLEAMEDERDWKSENLG